MLCTELWSLRGKHSSRQSFTAAAAFLASRQSSGLYYEHVKKRPEI